MHPAGWKFGQTDGPLRSQRTPPLLLLCYEHADGTEPARGKVLPWDKK